MPRPDIRITNSLLTPKPLSRLMCIAIPLVLLLGGNTLFLLLFYYIHFDTMLRITYNFNTLVMPLCLALFAVIAYRRRHAARCTIPRLTALWLISAVALFGLRVYATHIEPHLLQLREVTIATNKLSRPFTALHISDIQSGGIGGYEEKVFAKIRALNPDLILHTGDFLQPTGNLTHASELPKLARLFATLNPPLGMYTVEGESDTPILSATPTELGGIRFLPSESVEIHAKDLHIRLLGLSLSHTRTRHVTPVPLIENWLDDSPADALTIVMGHRPDYITRLLDLPIDLCLAGHTHGGQVRIPFYGAVVTPSGAPRKWARGYRELGATRLNVSAGIGAGHNKGLPSIRINCPPEMTLIRFVPSSST
jgi:uncharacterized protein